MLDNLYIVKNKQIEGTTARFEISFNSEHPIYAAHFPSNPITPGVCLINICKELTESVLEKSLLLQIVKNVKFLQLINPNENPNVSVQISIAKNEFEYKINASICGANESVFAKLSLVFQSINADVNG